MNGKLWRFVTGLLPIRFPSAHEPRPQTSQQTGPDGFPPYSPKVPRKIAKQLQRDRDHAIAINDLAGHIQSLEDAHKLIDLVGVEFSNGGPLRWVTRSIRNRVVRAEFESAANSGPLIPEQHVADVWNAYVQKIGVPQESFINVAEIHTLRDTYYVNSLLLWARGHQNIWTVPNIYAVGQDGKVANGCRALEALYILWQLRIQPEIIESTRELIKTGQLWSDMYKNPTKPPAPGSERGTVTLRRAPPNPVGQAALQYMRDHGVRAMNSTIEGLLKALFVG